MIRIITVLKAPTFIVGEVVKLNGRKIGISGHSYDVQITEHRGEPHCFSGLVIRATSKYEYLIGTKGNDFLKDCFVLA